MRQASLCVLLALLLIASVAATNQEAQQVQQQAMQNIVDAINLDEADGFLEKTKKWTTHAPLNFMSSVISEPRDLFVIEEWYGVANWEVEACMRDISTKKILDDAGNTFTVAPVPLVRDTYSTVSLVRKGDPIDYYDIGLYLQPYDDPYNVTVSVRTKYHGMVKIWPKPGAEPEEEREAKDSFVKRFIIPIPCNPDVHRSAESDREVLCFPPFDDPNEEIGIVNLRWYHTDPESAPRNLVTRTEEVT